MLYLTLPFLNVMSNNALLKDIIQVAKSSTTRNAVLIISSLWWLQKHIKRCESCPAGKPCYKSLQVDITFVIISSIDSLAAY